ncbi:MAG: type I DNA topoisomerase [Chloroflexi bacterium]|nr:type I DNA topoisomerase [Chloroflexota bacterium]
MTEPIRAYCMKCKTTREMQNPQAVYTSNGRPVTRGTCPVCGTTMVLMGRTDAHEGLPKPEIVTQARPAAPAKKARKSKATRKKKAVAKATPARSVRRSTSGKLVIVESPAKARTVSNFLGKGYTVKASKGHVRDLLVTQLSVDVAHDFEPKYRVPNDKRDIVKELKDAMDSADEIYLATDPDREGEAIAWHLVAAAEIPERQIRRVVFHEITKPAIQDAFSHPRQIDMSLVNAQQARRILDRLVGYNITELLWDKVRNRLSAGRVQSIAVRLVVDREREIEVFIAEEYWTLDARLRKQRANGSSEKSFLARLIKIGDQEVSFHTEDAVRPHLDTLERCQYTVVDVKHGTRQRKPAAPFTTSTLQQEASRRLGFSAMRTMAVAQQLYEGIEMDKGGAVGLITYMRTDSTNVSTQAQGEARDFIKAQYGEKYAPAKAPEYKTKTKGAQEAHEAIRPTSVLRQPESIKDRLTRDQFKLYQLIWQRFVASQMANAIYNTMRVDIQARLTAHDLPYLFRVSGSTIKFNGFLALYEEARDEDAAKDEDEGRILPELYSGEALDLLQLLPEQHFTQPPPRYTEATLVRTLEEYGIGRPSTYAPTVAIIQDREYVVKQDKRLVPTDTGKIVNDMLVRYFPNVMDHHFTARMEDQLDIIAEGDMEWRPMLRDFYQPFQRQLEIARHEMPSIQQEETIGRPCPTCGNPLVIRYGRFGKFIGCSTYPECRYTEPWLEHTGVSCPKCGGQHGGQLIVRKNKKGRTFYGCSRYPNCDYRAWRLPQGEPAEIAQTDDLSA